jgi:signal-transduction protein with cAMP-binding, CBS, and nucleotidyltransferase domain
MLVSEILRQKKNTATTIINPNGSVEFVIRKFKEKKIGAIMVCGPTGDLLGVVTERDVLHCIAIHGAKAFKKRVEDIMSAAYICKLDDEVREVMRVMCFKYVRHLPVVEDGGLKGLVSIGDIVKSQLDEADQDQ